MAKRPTKGKDGEDENDDTIDTANDDSGTSTTQDASANANAPGPSGDQSTGAILEAPAQAPPPDEAARVADTQHYRGAGPDDPRGAAVGPTVDHPGTYFSSPDALLKAIDEHARTTHGLAGDKAMFERISAYLKYHLTEMGVLHDESADHADVQQTASTASAR